MTSDFVVPDASCGHCKMTIENAVGALAGVRAADLDITSKRLRVDHDDAVTVEDVVGAIAAAGYTPQPA